MEFLLVLKPPRSSIKKYIIYSLIALESTQTVGLSSLLERPHGDLKSVLAHPLGALDLLEAALHQRLPVGRILAPAPERPTEPRRNLRGGGDCGGCRGGCRRRCRGVVGVGVGGGAG